MILEGYTTLATIILLGLLSERTRNREKVTVRDAALSESIDRLKEQKMISVLSCGIKLCHSANRWAIRKPRGMPYSLSWLK